MATSPEVLIVVRPSYLTAFDCTLLVMQWQRELLQRRIHTVVIGCLGLAYQKSTHGTLDA